MSNHKIEGKTFLITKQLLLGSSTWQ